MPTGLTFMRVILGDGVVTVKADGRSAPDVAQVLGREVQCGVETVYLDRLLHRPGQDWGEWTATGAISTILARPLMSAAGL